MIRKPKRAPSEGQQVKAERSIVWTFKDGDVTGYEVWDTETETTHRVVNSTCDCIGYQLRNYCSHLLAVEMHLENRGKLDKEAISELFDF